MREKKRGFTLTEVLIVVLVLASLIALILFALRNQIFKGNDAKRKGDIHRIRIAMEEYEKDNNCYPTPDMIICKPGIGLQPYLNKIPCDPTTKASYYIEVEDSTCPSWYRIYLNLENKVDSDIDETGCTYGCGPNLSYNFFVSSPNAPMPATGFAPEASSTPEPSIVPDVNFYGCFDGICRRISWDSERPGPECDPNWQRGTCSGQECCYDQCGPENKECLDWEL